MNTFRQIGWNGVRLTIPCSWETHIGGRNHLIFEEDFSPILEIRWQKAVKKSTAKSRAIFKRMKKTYSTLHEKKIPMEWSFLTEKFHVTCYGKQKDIPFDTGVCVCNNCKTLLFFQLSNQQNKTAQLLISSLKSLSCPCSASEQTFWSIQDFQLLLPSSFDLLDYSFGAGLTRISFRRSRLLLHTCKLAPADSRLSHQSLEEILENLADIPDLQMQLSEDGTICEGYRVPTITSQVFLRFKRKKPFIRAKIRHNTLRNRLLAVVLESIRPIPSEICQSISDNYEIIQV